MKKKRKIDKLFARAWAAALTLCVAVALPLFTVGCGTTLVYGGSALPEGTVGAEYMAYVGTATGSDEITYTLKEGSALPAGLELDPDGFVTGTPDVRAAAEKFTVVASAEGATAEAEFTLTVAAGAVAYAGGTVKAAEGTPFQKSVATATGATVINYALDGGGLPDGVTLSSDGTLSGTVEKISQSRFTVVASATDCASASAEFTLDIVKPWLEYEATALQTATAGSYFTGAVATAADGTGAEKTPAVTYALKSGSTLPAGLSIAANGLIHGIPAAAGTHKFTVVAKASGYEPAEAEFTLKTNPAFTFEFSDGTIIFAEKNTVSVEAGTRFIEIGAISASASNRRPVTFEITAGALPSGVTFYPNGTLAGSAGRAGNYALTVTATADKCDPVVKEITFAVLVTLVYKNYNYSADVANDLYVGEQCEMSLATASFPAGYENSGATIVYTVRSGLPEGLTLSEGGLLSGTPVRSVRTAALVVTASAEGFSAKNATFTLHIEDAVVHGVTRFEFEYTDLRGLTGSGYSGSSSGANMINSNSEVKASRSKDGKNYEEAVGGYYIPYVYGPITFTFNITADKAVRGAKLSLGLDSEIGTIAIDPQSFDISVNDRSVPYNVSVTGDESRKLSGFKNYAIGSVDLAAGGNVIEVSVRANDLNGSATGGPAVDYLQLGELGGASLSWRPALYNRAAYTQS